MDVSRCQDLVDGREHATDEEFDALGQRLGGRQHSDSGGVAGGGGPGIGPMLLTTAVVLWRR